MLIEKHEMPVKIFEKCVQTAVQAYFNTMYMYCEYQEETNSEYYK